MKTSNYLKITGIFVYILTVLVSCSTVAHSDAYSYNNTSSSNLADNDKPENRDRKIAYTSSINLLVKSPEKIADSINQLVKKYNGYIQRSSSSQLTLKVESKQRETALLEIGKLGKVLAVNSSATDLTQNYTDLNIRLENAQKSRQRYLELLEKAENVQAALAVEKELERLNETIELLEGKIKNIDLNTDYSTITVILKEKKKPGIIGYIGIGIYKAVKWLFVRN